MRCLYVDPGLSWFVFPLSMRHGCCATFLWKRFFLFIEDIFRSLLLFAMRIVHIVFCFFFLYHASNCSFDFFFFLYTSFSMYSLHFPLFSRLQVLFLSSRLSVFT